MVILSAAIGVCDIGFLNACEMVISITNLCVMRLHWLRVLLTFDDRYPKHYFEFYI